MTEFREAWLALVLALASTTAPAQGVKKCVDGEGNITFMQGDCPKTEAQQDVVIHLENRNPQGELQFPASPEPGLEWVWVASVLDDNNGGVIVRESGDAYVVESAYGCTSLWRYQESFAQVFSPGDFGDAATILLLPEHQQRCPLLSVSPMRGTVDLSGIPEVPAVDSAPPATARGVRENVREPRHSRSAPDNETACRSLRRRHHGLNQRCRGLEECDRKRIAIEDLQRQWAERRCEGALGIGPY